MSDVISITDRIELRAGLEDASQNLDKMLSAVTMTKVGDSGDPEAGTAFVQRFLEGSILPFPVPLEDSDALYDKMESVDLYGRLIKTIYAYKANPGLTLALALRFPDAPLMKAVTEDGHLVFTGLFNAQSDCLLDVNGVHAQSVWIEHLIGNNLGAPVFLKPTTVAELSVMSNFSEEDMQVALGNFGFVVTFMENHLTSLCSEPASWSMEEDDDLEEDDSPSPGF
jgi:hypothetical protein